MAGYERRKSADGSYTLYSKEYDECYHSLKDGAFREALYKHVEPAFSLQSKSHLRILDICFGLGINTLATIYYLLEKQDRVSSVEIFSPELDTDLIKQLRSFSYPPQLERYRYILEYLIENGMYRSENITIELFFGDARAYIKGLGGIDVVYQDPFSPKKNPTLWTVEYFKDIAKIMDKEGILTTYSIATPVRLALYEAGFSVYEKELEGVKKITVAAFKKLPLKKVDMELKKTRSTSSALRDEDIQR